MRPLLRLPWLVLIANAYAGGRAGTNEGREIEGEVEKEKRKNFVSCA